MRLRASHELQRCLEGLLEYGRGRMRVRQLQDLRAHLWLEGVPVRQQCGLPTCGARAGRIEEACYEVCRTRDANAGWVNQRQRSSRVRGPAERYRRRP